MRGWPGSLFGRVALIVCAGLALAHALTFFIILRERADLGQTMMGAYLGRDVATSVAILDRLTPAERGAWLPRLARQNYRYTLGQAPGGLAADDALAVGLAAHVVAELGSARVGRMSRSTQGSGQPDELQLPLTLSDGTALTLRLTPPRPAVSHTSLLLLALQLAVLGAAGWLAVRLALRPLARMAAAANALAPGSHHQRLADTGPREVAHAARAFNAMQGRIEHHLAERTQLLAAISHDLQSPITRLRLRVEQLADTPLRLKMHADLQAMQALVEEGLAYARSAHAAQEPPRSVDLHALLDGLVCDATDAGHQVVLAGRHEGPVTTRVQALRRVVANLLDNAIKFGGPARVEVLTQGEAVTITVLDNGPGIPPGELEAVLQPFYRVETSRSRATGGTGLGLAIAHQLSLALPGRLVLCNRPQGGLQASLTFEARTDGGPSQPG